jgi:hypothetical protein
MTRRDPEATIGAFDAAVIAEIEKGATSPEAVVTTLERKHGLDWMVDALSDLFTEVAERRVADLMRHRRLASERAAAKQTSIVRRRGRPRKGETAMPSMPTQPLLEALVYIPARHARVRYADCTIADLESRAELYERIAGSASTRATWCRDVASMMRAAHVAVLADLQSVPPLPDGTALDEFVKVAA